MKSNTGVGGMVPLGQQLLLLHHADHHRLRRPRSQPAEPGRQQEAHPLLPLPPHRNRHDRHELQPRPGAG